jgi:hypothetical protein
MAEEKVVTVWEVSVNSSQSSMNVLRGLRNLRGDRKKGLRCP